MPTLEVFLPAGHDAARKAELIARLTGATVDAIGAPIEADRPRISESQRGVRLTVEVSVRHDVA